MRFVGVFESIPQNCPNEGVFVACTFRFRIGGRKSQAFPSDSPGAPQGSEGRQSGSTAMRTSPGTTPSGAPARHQRARFIPPFGGGCPPFPRGGGFVGTHANEPSGTRRHVPEIAPGGPVNEQDAPSD